MILSFDYVPQHWFSQEGEKFILEAKPQEDRNSYLREARRSFALKSNIFYIAPQLLSRIQVSKRKSYSFMCKILNSCGMGRKSNQEVLDDSWTPSPRCREIGRITTNTIQLAAEVIFKCLFPVQTSPTVN